MAATQQVNLRVPPALLDRIDALIKDPPPSIAERGKTSRAGVIKEALHHGLRVLECERQGTQSEHSTP